MLSIAVFACSLPEAHAYTQCEHIFLSLLFLFLFLLLLLLSLVRTNEINKQVNVNHLELLVLDFEKEALSLFRSVSH